MFKRVLSMLLVLAMLVLPIPFSPKAAAADAVFADGVYILRNDKNPAFCVNGEWNTRLTAYSTALSNRYAISHFDDDTYLLRNLDNGRYLTCTEKNAGNNYDNYPVRGDWIKSGDNLKWQKWYITRQSNGSYVLKNVATGGVLDVNRATPAQDETIGQYSRTEGAASQQWILEPANETVHVALNPSLASPFHNGEFQGWGTALCWWANRVGYSVSLTEQTTLAFYSKEGLSLDIARYNIGGGDDPSHHHITRSDSEVPGTWKSFRYTNGGSDVEITYDATNDYRQLWVAAALKIVNPDIYYEGFSNSAPYFMLNSGCTSGSNDANSDNLRDDMYDDFAKYIAESTKLLRSYGIHFDSYSPINEPDGINTWWAWSSKQEGCRVTPGANRAKIISATRQALDEVGLNDVLVASFDDSNLDNTLSEMKQLRDEYPQATSDLGRIDTHTYSGTKRRELRALAQDMGKDLWMSEVDDGLPLGNSPMKGALWLANRIVTDVNHMQPAAWVMWNIVDVHKDSNFVNSKGEYSEKWNSIDPNGSFWGVSMADHDTQTLQLSQKYYGYGQFTRYIEPGDTIIASSDSTLAAYNKQSGDIKIVAVNYDTFSKAYEFDLAAFTKVGASVSTYRTSGTYESGEHWAEVNCATLNGTTMQATLIPSSITTFVIHGNGATKARTIDGGVYRLRLADGSYLSTNGSDYASNVTVSSTATEFRIEPQSDGTYAIFHNASNRALDNWDSNVSSGAAIKLSSETVSAPRKWTISANTDGTYSIAGGICLNMIARNGSNIGTYAAPNVADSHWILEPVTTIHEGVYAIMADDTLCVTPENDGASLTTFNNKAVTRYAVALNSDGTYSLRNLGNGKYLSAKNSYYISFADNINGKGEKWTFQTEGEKLVIQSAASNKVLDVEGGSIAADKRLGIWAHTEGAVHQLWTLKPLDSLIDGVYTVAASDGRVWNNDSNLTLGSNASKYLIRHTNDGYYTVNVLNNSNYLSYYPSSTPAIGHVLHRVGLYTEDPLAHANDQWFIIPNADGTYRFVSNYDGKCIGIQGNQLQAQLPSSDAMQSWTLSAVRTVNDGVYQLGAFNNKAKVLDVVGHGTAASTRVQLLTNSHADGQKFAIEYRDDGAYSIRDIHSNRYLNINAQSCTNDSTLLLYGQEGNAPAINEKFRILPNSDGTYSFVSMLSNQYIDLDSGNLADGTKVHTWQTTLSGNTQKWWLMPETVGYVGKYYICAGSDPSFAMATSGYNIVLSASKQMFRLRIEDGYYTIQNVASGRLLDVSGKSKNDGANLLHYTLGDKANGDNELWSIVPHYDGTVSFVSKDSGMYIDLKDNRLSEGNQIYMWSSIGVNPAKKWIMSGVNTAASMYCWDYYALNEGSYPDVQAYFRALNINRIYQKLTPNYLKAQDTVAAIHRLHADGIEVVALVGNDRELGINGASLDSVKQEIDALANYNNGIGAADKVTKIGLDIETYTYDFWQTDPVGFFTDYVNNMRQIYTYAHGKGLAVVQIIPPEFDAISATVFRKLVNECADELSIMNYTKATQVDAIAGEVAVCRELGKPIETIFETMPYWEYYGVTEANTYFYEGFDAMQSKRDQILNKYQYMDLTTSYHHFPTMYHVFTGKYMAEIYAYTDAKDPNRNAQGQTDALKTIILTGSDGSVITAGLYNPNLDVNTPENCYLAIGVKPNVTYTITSGSKDYAVSNGTKTFTYGESDLIAYTSISLTYTVCNHKSVVRNAKAATCTEAGYTGDTYCSKCGELLSQGQTIPAKGHNEVVDSGKNATCTESGLTDGKHCTVCGKVTVPQETIPAAGHTEVTDSGKNATCTESGLTDGKHCTVCGKVTVAQEVIPATGHKEVVDSGKAATCTEAGLTDGKHCTVCGKVTVAQEVIPATGHKEVVDSGKAATCTESGLTDGKHCTVCGKVTSEAQVIPALGHSYVHGVCERCGDATVYEDANLKFRKANLTLESSIAINFYVNSSVVEGFENAYVEFTKGNEKWIVRDYTTETLTDGSKARVYICENVKAAEMSTEVVATLYAEKNGKLFKGDPRPYSVCTYVSNQLKSSKDAKLNTLLVDMLVYGEAAQKYFNYNTKNLATAVLTSEQLAYATSAVPEMKSYTNSTTHDDDLVKIKSANLVMDNKVVIKYKLELGSYDINDLYLRITYVDKNNKAHTVKLDEFVFDGTVHTVLFDGLNPSQLRTLCTAEVYTKSTNTRISNSVEYSIESYAAKHPTGDKLGNLCVAMMKYGDSVAAYFK